MQAYDAEWAAYLLAGTRFYQDAEDAEGTEHTFFQSSVKLLRLAIDADSANASAELHLGKVLADKSYTGFGEWDMDTLNAAVAHLTRAERLAVGPYQPLLPAITKALRDQRANVAALGH